MIPWAPEWSKISNFPIYALFIPINCINISIELRNSTGLKCTGYVKKHVFLKESDPFRPMHETSFILLEILLIRQRVFQCILFWITRLGQVSTSTTFDSWFSILECRKCINQKGSDYWVIRRSSFCCLGRGSDFFFNGWFRRWKIHQEPKLI